MATKSVYLRITEDMEASVNKKAEELGVTRASMLKMLIARGLKNESPVY